MLVIRFYTTAGCHLCEQAEQLLGKVKEKNKVQWQSIDIAGDDDLIERYGIRIPVLTLNSDSNELAWPFTQEQIDHWLSG